MRLYIGFLFFILYLCWVVYRLFIKKDMRQHLTDLYALTFFIAIWLGIYYYIFL